MENFKNNMSTNQVLLNSKNALQSAGNAILFGGVIVYPTDTLYGFGVDARAGPGGPSSPDLPLHVRSSPHDLCHGWELP